MQLGNLLDEDGQCARDVFDPLSLDRLSGKAGEIDGMPGLKCVADLAYRFEAADPRSLPGTRIDDEDRALAVIDFGAVRRNDAQERVVDRMRQFVAAHHQLAIVDQDRGHAARQHILMLVTALAQDVQKQDRPLPDVAHIFTEGGGWERLLPDGYLLAFERPTPLLFRVPSLSRGDAEPREDSKMLNIHGRSASKGDALRVARLYRSRFSLRIDRHIREKSLGHLDVLSGAPAAGKGTDFNGYRGASDLNDVGKAGDFVTNEDWQLKAHLGHSDSDDSPLGQMGGDCAAS